MFLATTAITQLWDKNQKILFLGPWCQDNKKRTEWTDLDFQVMDNPWKDRKLYYDAFCYTDKTFEKYLKYLTEFLNKLHETSHSKRYWRILIGPWLLRFIYMVYDRYYHLLSAFREFDSLETWCLSSDCFVTPQNINHFRELYREDFYNLQLFSQILTEMGHSFSNFHFSSSVPLKNNFNETQRDIQRIKGIVRKQIKHHYSMTIDKISKRKKFILCDIYIPRRDMWEIVYKSKFQAWPLMKQWERDWPNISSLNDKAREGLKDLPTNDDFTKILVQSFPINFPTLYLEGYHRSRQEILHNWRKFPKLVMSSVGWFFNEYYKFFAAEASESGTHLLACQHGGGYGSGKIPVEKQEVKISDVFYSWGWTPKEHSEKVKPLPNPRLSKKFSKKDTYSVKKRITVLFVGTSNPRYLIYFYSSPVNSQFDEYINTRNDFVRSSPPRVRASLLFRLYPNDFGRYESKRLEEEFPNLRFDHHRLSLAKQTQKSRIVVIDHPLSSHLEVLSFNTPCILFWNPNYWEIRDEALPYYERLRQAEILFDTPEKAAAKLEEVYDNPAHWWLSAEVQEAKNEFVHQFALGSKDWVKRWVSEFQSI